jgi:hypothetical protein
MSVFLFILAIPVALIIIFYIKISNKIKSTISASVEGGLALDTRDPRHGVKSESRAIQNTVLEVNLEEERRKG